MGLSKRELLLLSIRAEGSQATGELNRVAAGINKTGMAAQAASLRMFGYSQAFQTVGTALTRAGAGIVGVAGLTTKLAVDFDRSMRLVHTQTDVGVRGFRRLEHAVLEMSRHTEHSTGELSEGLYDIFSGIDVTSKQAINMLELISRAATAGMTDVRTATRATIGMLNAFDLKVSETERVLDAQFKFVRLGVGTYEEFANVLGMLSGSAVAAGQSLETTVASLALATKGSLTASEAVTATARAMDLLTRPEIVGKLKKILGVEVVDEATGEYLQLNEIIQQFADKLEGMTRPEMKEALAEVFGTGEIRAFRFFNLAIPRIELFQSLARRTAGPQAMGAMNDAFQKMRQTASFSIGVAINRLKEVGIQIGRAFFPAIEDVLRAFGNLIGWFSDLNPAVRNSVASFLLWSGVIALVSGLVMKLIGSITGMISILRLAGVAFQHVAIGIAGVLGIITLAVGAFAQLAGGEKSAADAGGELALKIGAIILVGTTLVSLFMKLANSVPVLMFQNWLSSLGGIGATISRSLIPAMGGLALVGGIVALGFYQNAKAAREFNEAANELKDQLLEGETTLREQENLLQRQANAIRESMRAMGESTPLVGTQIAAYKELGAAVGQSWISFDRFARRAAQSITIRSPFEGMWFDPLAESERELEAAVRRASDAIEDQVNQAKAAGTQFSKFELRVIGVLQAQGKFHKASQLASDIQENQQTAIENSVNALRELSSQHKITAQDIIREMRQQANAVDDYENNWRTLVKRNIPKDFAQELADMGLSGAQIIEHLASVNDRKFKDIVQDWRDSEQGLEDVLNLVDALGVNVDRLPKDHNIKFKGDDAHVKSVIHDVREAIEGLSVGVEFSLGGLPRNFYTSHEGGYIHGLGKSITGMASNEMPAILEAGEYIFSKKAVDFFGREYLENLHHIGKKKAVMHEGGPVGSDMSHGHVTFQAAQLAEAVTNLADSFVGALSNVSTAGLNEKASLYLRAITGLFPNTYLLSGRRFTDSIEGPTTSQHLFGNATDISDVQQAYMRLWPAWWWSYANRNLFDINYMVLGAGPGAKAISAGAGIYYPGSGQDADHFNHIHTDFLPSYGVYHKGGIPMNKMMALMNPRREAILPLDTTYGQRQIARAFAGAMTLVPQLQPQQQQKVEHNEMNLTFNQVKAEPEEIVSDIDWLMRTRAY